MKIYNRAVVYFESLIFAILFVAPTTSYSQQDPVYAQYTNNLLTIQPAYAGLSGTLNCTGIARAQWIGFDGAPNTNTFTLSGPIQKYSLGLGLSIVNDRWGPIKQNGVYIDYAYRVKIVKDQYLSFGLKGGFNLYQADLTNLAIWDHPDRRSTARQTRSPCPEDSRSGTGAGRGRYRNNSLWAIAGSARPA